MMAESNRILNAAGVDLGWVECEAGGKPLNVAKCAEPARGLRVTVQLVAGKSPKNPRMTGVAIIDKSSAPFALLYVERIAQLARDANWGLGDLLGHAVAHELGHILLGTSGHTSAGIMRARWESEELRRLSHSGLVFLPGQLTAAISRLLLTEEETSGPR